MGKEPARERSRSRDRQKASDVVPKKRKAINGDAEEKRAEEKRSAKEKKEGKDPKELKESKENKDMKSSRESKDAREAKEHKESKDAKVTKEEDAVRLKAAELATGQKGASASKSKAVVKKKREDAPKEPAKPKKKNAEVRQGKDSKERRKTETPKKKDHHADGGSQEPRRRKRADEDIGEEAKDDYLVTNLEEDEQVAKRGLRDDVRRKVLTVAEDSEAWDKVEVREEDDKEQGDDQEDVVEEVNNAPAVHVVDERQSPRQAVERRRDGPRIAHALDDASLGVSSGAGSRSSSRSGSLSGSESRSGSPKSRKRRRSRERRGLRAATGFSEPALPPPPAPGITPEAGMAAYGPAQSPGSTQLAVLPEKLRGLMDSQQSLAQELEKLKQGVTARTCSTAPKEEKEEGRETVLRMPQRLHESLLHPENVPKLLQRTGLASACLNEDGLVVLTAMTRKGLTKALGQLRRIAYHCQWGCSKAKVASLLSDKANPVHTMVVRLAATTSRLQSFEARLTHKVRKLRIGTQAGACQLNIEGIPGLSRKHCTITLEPEKGSCYVQDLSTNGTYLNGKRLPRPPYKNPQDARVRLFHGDELFFRLRSEDNEELGYVVNLYELS